MERAVQVLKGLGYISVAIVLLPLCIAFAAIAKRLPAKIIRHRDDVLQTPVVFYRHPKTGRELVFVAVIHIGETEYFADLQRVIDVHPSHAVLFEMIGTLTREQESALTLSEREILKGFEMIREMVQSATSLLGLSYQKDGLTYRPHWINTDITMFDLLRLFDTENLRIFEESDTKISFEGNALLVRWLLDVLLSNFVPVVMAARFVSRFSGAKKGQRKIILDVRNKIACTALHEHLQDQDVITIWGAEHLRGIEKYIRSVGFKEVHREWFDAYRPRRYSFREVLKEFGEETRETGVVASE